MDMACGYLGCPRLVGLVLGRCVHGWGGVKRVDAPLRGYGEKERKGTTNILVDIVDELVDVLEPRVGVLIVEVGAHGEHDVVLEAITIELRTETQTVFMVRP
jgi:hypothetical protein